LPELLDKRKAVCIRKREVADEKGRRAPRLEHPLGGISVADEGGFEMLPFDNLSIHFCPLPIEFGDERVWSH
jgi:hypothetical protein